VTMTPNPTRIGELTAALFRWARERPKVKHLNHDLLGRPKVHDRRISYLMEGVQPPQASK